MLSSLNIRDFCRSRPPELMTSTCCQRVQSTRSLMSNTVLRPCVSLARPCAYMHSASEQHHHNQSHLHLPIKRTGRLILVSIMCILSVSMHNVVEWHTSYWAGAWAPLPRPRPAQQTTMDTGHTPTTHTHTHTALRVAHSQVSLSDPGYMSSKNLKFRADKFDT